MRIVVGMSGGVDSAVSALLLKRQGHEVIGVFMKNWDEKDENGACTSDADYLDVCRDCDKIGIPYYTVNFTERYMRRVFDSFLEEYAAGRTPNPDVLCNREIKFGAFLDYAGAMDADYIATGHYARVEYRDGAHRLLKGSYGEKDQSYFLYMLNQSQLSRAMFPIGGMDKPTVRGIAKEAGLAAANKRDSTGICFIGERNFKKFLMQYMPTRPGDIVNLEGITVGRHDGLCYYTIGQRRGLGISGQGSGERWFVVDKDAGQNRLIVRQGEGPELYSAGCRVIKTYFTHDPPGCEFECTAKFRYRQRDIDVRVSMDGEGCTVEFSQHQRAVTPGQSAVFYDGDECLGGGIIESVYRRDEK